MSKTLTCDRCGAQFTDPLLKDVRSPTLEGKAEYDSDVPFLCGKCTTRWIVGIGG